MTKPQLLLLHGALGARDQFALLAPCLVERFEIHSLDFEGHGSNLLPARPFRIEHFAENAHDYLMQCHLERVNIFGYSMGGYVALLLAKTHPHLVANIATLGTKFKWGKDIAAREIAFLDPQKIKTKVPQFAQTLAARHAIAGWEHVVERTREMMLDLGERGGIISPQDLASLTQRVRIMIGDRDTTVTLDESVASYRALANGELQISPNTPHPFEKVSVTQLANSLSDFFDPGQSLK